MELHANQRAAIRIPRIDLEGRQKATETSRDRDTEQCHGDDADGEDERKNEAVLRKCLAALILNHSPGHFGRMHDLPPLEPPNVIDAVRERTLVEPL